MLGTLPPHGESVGANRLQEVVSNGYNEFITRPHHYEMNQLSHGLRCFKNTQQVSFINIFYNYKTGVSVLIKYISTDEETGVDSSSFLFFFMHMCSVFF